MLEIFIQNEQIKNSRETTQNIIEENQHTLNYVLKIKIYNFFSTNNGKTF